MLRKNFNLQEQSRIIQEIDKEHLKDDDTILLYDKTTKKYYTIDPPSKSNKIL